MEFKELARSVFKQNAVLAFNLTSSGGYNVGLLGSTSEAILLEMKHSTLATHTFPYAVETIKLPAARPAAEVVNKFDMAEIYTQTNNTKRHYFALDPIFVTELSEDPVKFQAVALEWCPQHLNNNSSLLAVVSSNGACELRSRDTISREWKMKVCNLNQLYLDMFPVPVPVTDPASGPVPEPVPTTLKNQTFEDLKEAVENTSTTAFSWNMDPNFKRSIFVTANGTGWLLLFSLETNGVVSCLKKYKTALGRISLVHFFGNFILTCSSNGIIKIFALKGNEIEDVDTLWPNADRIPCKKLSMSFCKESSRWICVTSKSAHAIVFILSKEGKLLFKNTSYLGNIKITGFELVSPKEYIFVTITGRIKFIKFHINKSNCEINSETVKYDFDNTNYQVLGLVSSPNKVAWTFLLFHNKPYTHPSLYTANDAIITVCSLSCRDAYKTITDETIVGESIENAIDCAEIIRLEILKDNILPKYDSLSIQEVKLTKHYFKKLQLKLLTMNAGLTYQRIKFNHVKKLITNEINSITKIIECVYINLRLQRLRNFKSYTPFQILSGKCMKYKLKLLQSELIPNEDIFRNVHENLNTLSDCLLMDLGNMFDDATENCSYCDKPIDFSTLMCPDLHSVPRCSISFLQVPLFTRVFCSCCNRLFVDNIENLKSIFGNTDDVKCTFCGFSISVDMAETFDKEI
ncbi:uncharacterized protein LOC129948336 [Eupeodes corollae]|uniref:uncharacterized protein LOC129948336 n=1 Tax=Eupeodes corollae TaxID=290404 RepID=UPI002492881B|nr:uncharacterized protein LOC129948336 [Eupeodes corollae]